MEEQTPSYTPTNYQPVTDYPEIKTEKVVEKQSNNNFLVPLLSLLLLASVGIAGFFAFQTQRLVSDLTNLKSELNSPTVQPVGTEAPVSTDSAQISTDPTLSWKSYSDTKTGFSIKYPSTWRIAPIGGGGVGFGPAEIQEDVIWGVMIYDKSTNTLENIIAEYGKQFPDRKQVVNKINVGNLSATQVITTTNTVPDWYLENIIFEAKNDYVSLSNGAVNDENLVKLVGVTLNTSFRSFYSTFALAK